MFQFSHMYFSSLFVFFFFNYTATTEIYTLSLHDALPIFEGMYEELVTMCAFPCQLQLPYGMGERKCQHGEDRKSTRLNSSHQIISYAVFCLKKKTRNI